MLRDLILEFALTKLCLLLCKYYIYYDAKEMIRSHGRERTYHIINNRAIARFSTKLCHIVQHGNNCK